ncbi:hypothetical protein BGZ65_005926 [Modicella reniformis]|uniref:NAD(+) ADP-ribosyltransferase n=1 Tax=Modicella reniformis TaxID=1440133 RepID=A0A9P6IJM8_9FUNG|nr:hypothetical protein BGZ65_005926 [Modicella reniformis]
MERENVTLGETIVITKTTVIEEKVPEVVIIKEEVKVLEPAVTEKTSWFRRALSATEAAAHKVASGAAGAAGAVAHGAESAYDGATDAAKVVAVGTGALALGAGALVVGAAYGAGHAAAGAARKVDGVWKRTAQVLTTRKAHVDEKAPIAKTAYVYYDDHVYDSVLIDKETGHKHVTQLLYDSDKKVYYVYYRWSETEYSLGEPYETVEEAKKAYLITYKDKFDIDWNERETVASKKWTVETKEYVEFETVEEVEEVLDEADVLEIIKREQVKSKSKTTTIEKDDDKKKVVIAVEGIKEKGVVSEPAATKGTSWFRRLTLSTGAAIGAAAQGAKSAAHGVGTVAKGAAAIGVGAVVVGVGAAAGIASGSAHLASGALEKVDGVWKRTVGVLTTHKAHVDDKVPIAKTAVVYFEEGDDNVYDAELVETETGIKHVTQLIYDTDANVYYVYYRYGETDYKLDGPHETVESAKVAFETNYKDKFSVDWKDRNVATCDKYTYEPKTYEEVVVTEYVVEVVEETEVDRILADENVTLVGNTIVSTDAVTTVETVIVKDDKPEVITWVITEDKTTVTAPATGEKKKTSWLGRAVGATGDAARKVGAGVAGVGTTVAHGAEKAYDGVTDVAKGVAIGTGVLAVGTVVGVGLVTSAAVHKVGDVFKHTAKVVTTHQAHVDDKAPIAKTAVVYYDEDTVYDSVVVDSNTGNKHVTQLLYDNEKHVYHVYYRWSDTEYTLSESYETAEDAKKAYLLTYKDKFDIDWTERDVVPSQKWTVEKKEYVEFTTEEEIEEIIEEKEAVAIIKGERETGQVTESEEIVKVITTMQETGVIAQPVVSKETSWFRRLASGAGDVKDGALSQVGGVWKRAVEVVTTRKADVDEKAPIAKTSFVYYDDDVYDSVQIEKTTGVKHISQLLYDDDQKAYFIYIRWSDKDYRLEGPYKTIDEAKRSFLIIYKEWYGIEWSERQTVHSDKWTVETRTYETIEETEVIEETVEDLEVSKVVATGTTLLVGGAIALTGQTIVSTHDDSRIRSVTESTILQERGGAQETTRTHFDNVTRDIGGPGGSGSSSTDKKATATFDVASLPQLDAPINAETGAPMGIYDLRYGTAEALREMPADLRPRPRAWVSLHVGGWQDAPHELQGFMRLDDQTGQRLMEQARDEAQGKSQEATSINNHRLPEIVALFAQKLYGHFGEDLPEELSLERLSQLGPHRR